MINPYPLAMVVCDAIWMDPVTGKRTLLGCFMRMFAETFPMPRRAFAVYVALTGGRSQIPVRLQLEDAARARPPILIAETMIEARDPRTVLEVEFHLAGVVFPLPGRYSLQLFAWDALVVERWIDVAHATTGTES